MFLFLLGCNRSGGKSGSSAQRRSPPQPLAIGSLPASQTTGVRGVTARLHEMRHGQQTHSLSIAAAHELCDLQESHRPSGR